MKKLLVTLLLATSVAMFSGCGSSQQSIPKDASFNVDTDKYKQDGYSAISDIAYIKIDDDEKMVNLVCLKNNPDEAVLILADLTVNDITGYDYTITWNGEEYQIISDDILKDATQEDVVGYYPEDWKDTLNNGSQFALPEETKDAISTAVHDFVKEYHASTGTDDTELIKKEDYSYSGGKITMSLNSPKEEGKYGDIYIAIEASDMANAYYGYVISAVCSQYEEFNTLNFTVVSRYDGVLFTSEGVLTKDSNGKTKIESISDYMLENTDVLDSISEEQQNQLTEEIAGIISTFIMG